jgi:hypothetical protein
MSYEYEAVLMIGRSVQDIGLTVREIADLPAWDDNEYFKDNFAFDVQFENCLSGPEDDDTYIGFNMSKDLDFSKVEEYKERFKNAFGMEAKSLLFTHVG